MQVAAIIPAWNEAGAIGPTIAALPRPLIRHIIVVDGGSTDGTQAEAAAAGAIVITQSRRGYGAACAEGAAHAEALGATLLLFLDGDGADAGERAAELLTPLLQGTADFTIATRRFRESRSMLWHPVLAGQLIGRAVGLATGTTYRDMAAFRALSVQTLDRLGMRQMTYGWNLEMQMRAAALRLRILQIDMPYRRRIAGHSKVAGNLAGTLKASWRILATLVSISRELRVRRR
jgi:glycosyltransferase involved in cell wall biosynthesis